jgi:putative endonuclease
MPTTPRSSGSCTSARKRAGGATSPRPTACARSSRPAASSSRTHPKEPAGSAGRPASAPPAWSWNLVPVRASTHQRGRAAEQAAERWLVEAGYQILERNVVNHAGEIDLIARDSGGTLCFIEVKARATAAFGPAIAAVTAAKRRRLSRAAALHLALRGLHLTACRFDVLGLDKTAEGWKFTLVQDAFPFSA